MDSPRLDASPLCEGDLCAVVNLLGEVIAAPGSHKDKKRVLMDGLCAIIGADAWVWTLAHLDPEAPPVCVGFMHGGFDDERFANFLQGVEHPDMQWIVAPFARELQHNGNHLTRLRQQVDPEEKFQHSGVFPLWQGADVGPFIFSARQIPGGGASGLGLYRNVDRPMFTERESRIAHIVLAELPWLHLQDWPEDRGISAKKLTPRERLVLNALVHGWSRKKIAEQFGLSVNTVHGYVKDVFQRFGVHSQVELISRFSRGDGGDAPHEKDTCQDDILMNGKNRS